MKLTTEHDLQKVLFPYMLLAMYEKDFNKSDSLNNLKISNILNINIFKTIFSLNGNFN